jgi:hypothetical protein
MALQSVLLPLQACRLLNTIAAMLMCVSQASGGGTRGQEEQCPGTICCSLFGSVSDATDSAARIALETLFDLYS